MAIDDLLRELARRDGSDLHLLEGLPAKARVHGALEAIADESPDTAAWIEGMLDKRHREMFARAGEADLAYEVEDVGRFRVNVFRHHGGVGAIFRIIPQTIPTIDELRLPQELNRFASLSGGLVVITGPTGCGKSSTLAALLDVINQREARHIITIEDPVEYVHVDARSTFTQREVGRDTESVADALRSAARQDPDLLLVGEMRDRETNHLAQTLAEMCKLVYSTLHTTSATRTIWPAAA